MDQEQSHLKKVVIIGPESTGKSTLCSSLASYYKTNWCPEYAREYLLTNGKNYSYESLLHIAKGQLKLEDDYVSKTNDASSILFIDTDLYVMKVWCEYVFAKCHHLILDGIAERKYDLYLLCNIDLPWIADELREYPDEKYRNELYHMYKDILINQQTPWIEIKGSYKERLYTAINAVNNLLQH